MKLSEMPALEAVLIVAARQAGSRVRNLQAQQKPVDSSILIPVQEFLEAHDPVYEDVRDWKRRQLN